MTEVVGPLVKGVDVVAELLVAAGQFVGTGYALWSLRLLGAWRRQTAATWGAVRPTTSVPAP